MPRQTQQQRFLTMALAHVEDVRIHERSQAHIYGGLCHKFPITVRTNGLCQALAFVHEKRGAADAGTNAEPRNAAFARLWQHAAAVIGEEEGTLLKRLQTADTATYLRDTRRILDAWVFYKRFAVSILNVPADADVDGEPAAATPVEATP